MSNKVQLALELRKALEMFVSSFDPETDIDKILSIPTVFPKYKIGVNYKIKDVFSYGENANGDPQLYQVLQTHTSTTEWIPSTATSLYKAVGVSENGIATWVQPLGASDAYNKGDEVMYNGAHYKSLIDNNVWSPETYSQGWEVVVDDN